MVDKKIPKIIIPRQIPSSQDFWLLKNIFSKVFFKRYRVSVPPRLSSISFGMDQCLFIVIMTGITICDWQVWLGLLMFWSIRLGNHKKTKDSGARRPRAVFLVSSSFEVGKVWYEKFCTRTIAVFFKVEMKYILWKILSYAINLKKEIEGYFQLPYKHICQQFDFRYLICH